MRPEQLFRWAHLATTIGLQRSALQRLASRCIYSAGHLPKRFGSPLAPQWAQFAADSHSGGGQRFWRRSNTAHLRVPVFYRRADGQWLYLNFLLFFWPETWRKSTDHLPRPVHPRDPLDSAILSGPNINAALAVHKLGAGKACRRQFSRTSGLGQAFGGPSWWINSKQAGTQTYALSKI